MVSKVTEFNYQSCDKEIPWTSLTENVFFEIGRISFIRADLKIGRDGEDFMDSLSKFHSDVQYGKKDWLYLLV